MFGIIFSLIASSAFTAGTTAAVIAGAVGAIVGGLLDQAIFAAKPPAQERGRLDNLQVNDASYGAPMLRVLGAARVGGNVIWIGNGGKWIEEVVTRKVRAGLFSKQTIREYHYSLNLAVALCEGPVAQVRRVWFGDTIIYEYPGSYFGCDSVTVYAGSETQTADPLIVADQGSGNVEAYRGTCYIVIRGLDADVFGAALQPITAEVLTRAESFSSVEGPRTASGYTPLGGVYVGVVQRPELLPDGRSIVCSFKSLGGGNVAPVATILDNRSGTLTVTEVQGTTFSGGSMNYQGSRLNPSRTLCALTGMYVPSTYATRACFFSIATETWVHEYSTTPRSTNNGVAHWVADDVLALPATATSRDLQLRLLHLVGGVVTRVSGPHTVLDHTEYLATDVSPGVLRLDGGVVWAAVSYTDNTVVTRWLRHRRTSVAGEFVDELELGDQQVLAPSGFDSSASMEGFGLETVGDVTVAVYRSTTNTRVVPVTATVNGLILGTPADFSSAIYNTAYGYSQWFPYRQSLCFVYQTSASDRALTEINLIDASPTLARTATITPTGGGWPSFRGGLGEGRPTGIFSMINGYASVIGGYVDDEPVSIAEAVETWLDLAGYETSDYDTSNAPAVSVTGQVLTPPFTARDAITQLQTFMPFDLGLVDGVLKAQQRSTTPVKTLSYGNLGSSVSERPDRPVIERARSDELDLPRAIILGYLDPAQSYQPAAQRAERVVTTAVAEDRVNLPLVITADQAKQAAERLLFTRWYERVGAKTTAARDSMLVAPGDVVTVDNAVMRVVSESFTENGLEWQLIASADISALTSTATSGLTASYLGLAPYPAGTTLLLDLPPLSDDVDTFGVYVAGGGPDNWPNGVIQRSTDLATWDDWVDVRKRATFGVATTVLASAQTSVISESTTVTIRLTTGDLAGCTTDELLAGANLILIGSELLRFRDVTDNADGSYTLGGLLRGRYGTEWAVGTHVVGDKVVLIDSAVEFIPMPMGERDRVFAHALIAPGQDRDSVPRTWAATSGEVLRPYSPASAAATRDGSNNLTITLVRRARINNGLQNLIDVPLDEWQERYEVDVMSGGTVLRTLSASSATLSYSAAEQTADGLTPGDPVSVRAYQLSDRVGRGRVLETTL